MRTVTIQRYSELTDQQWKHVVASLKRQVRKITGQSSEIGIGRKYSDGKPSGWQVAIRVYLPQKRQRVSRAKQIPGHFHVKLRRADGKYDLLTIRSDVESLSDYLPTSAKVKLGRGRATSGFLLRWSPARGSVKWGFATVAHLFDQSSLRITSVRVDSTTKFQCRLAARSSARQRSDFSVLEIVGTQSEIEQKLLGCDLISTVNPPAITLMSVRQVHRSATDHQRGRSYTSDGDQRFVGEEIFPDGFRIGTRRLDDCIRVGQASAGTFQPGTSGADWRFGSRAACIQVGGKSPEFREGIGQPLQRFARWIRTAVDSSAKIVAAID